jgi:DNA invertase Pin-like site-specific DNA recombinase
LRLKCESCNQSAQKKIFREQISSVASRAQLEGAIDFCREGDMLVVCNTLKAKDVGLRILNMNFDTASPTGKMMLTILGSNCRIRAGDNARKAKRRDRESS